MIMTLEELRESADVFAIELLDIQRSHKTLFGQDVVAAIDVPMNLHRIEVEHELRTTLLRLRHHLLLSPDNQDELRAVLAKSITSVLTLFRHALIVLGRDPPQAKPQLLETAGENFGFEVQPMRSILALRNEGPHPEELARAVPCVHECNSAGRSRTGCAGTQASVAEIALGRCPSDKANWRGGSWHEKRNHRTGRNCVAAVLVRQHLRWPSQRDGTQARNRKCGLVAGGCGSAAPGRPYPQPG